MDTCKCEDHKITFPEKAHKRLFELFTEHRRIEKEIDESMKSDDIYHQNQLFHKLAAIKKEISIVVIVWGEFEHDG